MTATAHRNLGELDVAGWNLDRAFRLARGCDSCQADLLRRRGFVHAAAGLQGKALEDSTAAIEAYQKVPRSLDHNLSGYGLADSYLTRGNIRQYFGIPAGNQFLIHGALEDFAQALALANPEEHRRIYGHGLLNLGYVLRVSGGLGNLLTADKHIREARKFFGHGRKVEASRERTYLDWQTAMVRFELRRSPGGLKHVKERPAHLKAMLARARDAFIELGMPPESAAVAADLALLAYPQRCAVREVMDDTYNLIAAKWPEIRPEVRRAFKPVRKAMVAVRQAA